MLLLAMARYLTPSEVGLFGLVAGSLATFVLLIGLEFYAFSNREAVTADADRRVVLMRSQARFHVLSYGLLLPAASILFVLGLVPWHVAPWWYLLLVAEHMTTELYRLQVALHQPLAANVTWFLKSSAWALGAAALLTLNSDARHIHVVWVAWLAGLAVAAVAAWFVTFRHLPWAGTNRHSVDRAWIRRGLSGMLPLFVSSLALKVLENADRFALDAHLPRALVGVYVFYWGLASAIQALMYSGIVMFSMPALVRSAGEDHAATRAIKSQMSRNAVLGALILSMAAVVCLRPILPFAVSDPIYIEHFPVFIGLLLFNVIVVSSWAPHYYLYAYRQDRSILYGTLASIAVTLPGLAFLVPRHGMVGALVATVLGATAMLIAKTVLARGLSRDPHHGGRGSEHPPAEDA